MSVGAGAGYWIVCDDRGLRIMSGLSAAVSLLIPGERRDYTRREVPVTASNFHQVQLPGQRYGRLAASPSTSPPGSVLRRHLIPALGGR